VKPTRLIALIVLVAVCGLLVWHYMPGCRQVATDAYRKYGGWTEDARRDDPVGFIEYAQERLEENLTAFASAQANLAGARQTIADELARMETNLAAADELAVQFRDAYRGAEEGDGYPVTVAGRDYERQELINQVGVILRQKADYEGLIDDLGEERRQVEEKDGELAVQITDTKAALATLPSKKEIARINELTGDTQDLLEQVNALIGENEGLLTPSPVRTVEELVRARQQETEGGGARSTADAHAFLEGEG
jgi:hypothetical protein